MVEEYISKITQWHHDRNLIDGATDKDQLAKLIQEMGELVTIFVKVKTLQTTLVI